MNVEMMEERKTYEFKFTSADSETGRFKGYASVFGVEDSYKEAVDVGAFKRTLKAKKKFPALWSHNTLEPIGVLEGAEDQKGLQIDGEFNLDVQRAREIRSLARQGAVNGLSIGFKTVKDRVDKETGVRHLTEIDLWEVSLCVFQACPGATVQEVKSLELKPFPNEHAARLRDPDDFDSDTFRRKSDGTIYGKIKVPETVDVIWGKLKSANKPEDYPIPQTLRFPTKSWTAADAKKWLADNDVKYISFEPAAKSIAAATAILESIILDRETVDRMEYDALAFSMKMIAERLAEADRAIRGVDGSDQTDRTKVIDLLESIRVGYERDRKNL